MSKRKTAFERLLDILPGFHGYRRKEFLREDDRLARNYLVRVLDETIHALEDVEAFIVDRDFPTAERLDEIMRDLRKLADEIRWAEHGYTPHYNIVKVREEELMKLIDFDASLVDDVHALKKLVEEMREDALKGNPVREKAYELYRTINGLKEKWLKRLEIITGSKPRESSSEG